VSFVVLLFHVQASVMLGFDIPTTVKGRGI